MRSAAAAPLAAGLAVCLGAALVPLGLAPGPAAAPARAVELQGQTWFARPPWKVEFRNYYWYVMQAGGEYYFTVTLPEQAGVGLGGLVIQQIRGVDTTFPFDLPRTRAFLGRPRGEGPSLPVQASFQQERRRFDIRFPQPPQPGQTVTLALRPWFNPSQADTYLFAVQALPAGPNPVPASLGVATLAIYDGVRF
jgi:hypothetical protein